VSFKSTLQWFILILETSAQISRIWPSFHYQKNYQKLPNVFSAYRHCNVIVIIQISQGNAATDLKWRGGLYNSFFRSSLFIVECKYKRIVKIGSYLPKLSQKDCVVVFFDSQCIYVIISAGYYSHISTLADVHEHVQVRTFLCSPVLNIVGLFYIF